MVLHWRGSTARLAVAASVRRSAPRLPDEQEVGDVVHREHARPAFRRRPPPAGRGGRWPAVGRAPPGSPAWAARSARRPSSPRRPWPRRPRLLSPRMRLSRVSIPSVRPRLSTTGNSRCSPASSRSTAWARVACTGIVLKLRHHHLRHLQPASRHPRGHRARLGARAEEDEEGHQHRERGAAEHHAEHAPARGRRAARPSAAIRVARTSPNRRARSARSTRPPSSGNAGIRLNSSTGAVGDHQADEDRGRSPAGRAAARPGRWPRRQRPAGAAGSRSVTAGPASAMTSSCAGSSGIRSRRATPPMGSRMTSGVRTPNRAAIDDVAELVGEDRAEEGEEEQDVRERRAAPAS